MSLILDRPVTAARTVSPARTSSATSPLTRAPAAAPAPDSALASAPATAEPAAPRPRALPEGTEARGFALYVGIDEVTAAQTGAELGDIVAQIKALVAQIAPAAETHAAVAIAPTGAGGRDVDVVRLALQDPSAVAARRQAAEVAEEPGARGGVVVDISRKRVLLDGEAANLTYKEFELLQYLVLREGRTIERSELISGLWADGDGDDEVPNERTIDVHVRRLRSKLGAFEDVVRTVRGAGYRFDRHADVSIRHASTPSPDLF
ncbi:winged helix-turn-helix transcriptional regulator [Frigoribacterium sp. ACAM 257]|uniref:winged helix-turn-helix domain-containing protein n=1 Tax=Frigoribacterium sp. ACAM 257 TaxID=2508998 RepID=UPI0011BA27FD|nr:winged helix-turn-helix domain-containing protein [Frigoribacterium sp. ACAM 257]TWX40094.1 winged helix-turn-helix transcriptional regulator [Frigoribacterium sp. ACAM 257]